MGSNKLAHAQAIDPGPTVRGPYFKFLKFICVCVWLTRVHMWRSEDSLWDWSLSLYHLGPRSRTQPTRFESRCLHLLSRPSGSWCLVSHTSYFNCLSGLSHLLTNILMFPEATSFADNSLLYWHIDYHPIFLLKDHVHILQVQLNISSISFFKLCPI